MPEAKKNIQKYFEIKFCKVGHKALLFLGN